MRVLHQKFEMKIKNLEFHHIGIACKDLESEMERFFLLGYEQESADFIDPIQGIKGRFIIAKKQPRMELLVNHGEKGTLSPWIKKGIKMYHICYKSLKFYESINQMEELGAKVIVEPVEAVAFENSKIAFLMLPNRLLIELVEKSKNGQ